VIDAAKRAVTESDGDWSSCDHQRLHEVAHVLDCPRPERSTLLAIFAVFVLLTRARTTTEEQLCSELGVNKRLVQKWHAWIHSALASPSNSVEPFSAILTAKHAINLHDGDVAGCEPELRALASAMNSDSRGTKRSTLIALMAAVTCATDGLPIADVLADVQLRYPATKLRNVQKWTRDLSRVLAASVDQIDMVEFSSGELSLLE
jgi:hypothetical protein